MNSNIFRTAAAAVLILAASGCQKQINFVKARSELNKGVKSFAAANYASAATHFEAAAEYDSSLLAARTYQAYSYMMQYVPGGESEENLDMAQQAIDGFMAVLEDNPEEITAISSLASLYFNMKNFDKAIEWHHKRIAVDPTAKDSFYTIGVINWTRSYQPRLQVRADLGMKPEDPGPIKDKEKREELAESAVPIIEEGLSMLEKALAIDPDYDDAMAYVNLLYRERADFAESKEEYEQYLATADEWVQKTLDTKKRKVEESTIDQFTAE